jgi:flavodoxin
MMKALVVYDSIYGNTKKIAETVARELGKGVKVISVSEFSNKNLKGIDLLVVGSPILAFRPSEKTGKFLAGLGADQLKGIKAAAFDTRVRIFFHGDAAGKIASRLKQAGAEIVAEPCGFIVEGREGPLAKDALEKAKEWAGTIKARIK